jgi:hypothetical protein
MELMEDAHIFAKAFVIADLLENQAPTDFFNSTCHKIIKLQPIFYKDRPA